jgi:hypothetical protein
MLLARVEVRTVNSSINLASLKVIVLKFLRNFYAVALRVCSTLKR